MIREVDVINKVVEHYGSDPKNRRSITGEINNLNQDVCRYNGPNGTMCAVAYFVKPDMRKDLMEGYSIAAFMRIHGGKRDLSEMLNDNVKHIVDLNFWNEIQSLHDNSKNWDKKNNSLSAHGKYIVGRLLEKYEN